MAVDIGRQADIMRIKQEKHLTTHTEIGDQAIVG